MSRADSPVTVAELSPASPRRGGKGSLRNRLALYFGLLTLALVGGIAAVVSWRLERGMARQTELFGRELVREARVALGRQLQLMEHLVQGIQREVRWAALEVGSDPVVVRAVAELQEAPLSARLAAACTQAGLDFASVYDAEGVLLGIYPPAARAYEAARTLRGSPLGERVRSLVDAPDPEGTPTVDRMFRADEEFLEVHALTANGPNRGDGIVVASASVVREAFGAPVGFAVVGRVLNGSDRPLRQVWEATGSAALLHLDRVPIAQVGFGETKPVRFRQGLGESPGLPSDAEPREVSGRLLVGRRSYLAACRSFPEGQVPGGGYCVALPESQVLARQEAVGRHARRARRELQGWILWIGVGAAGVVAMFSFALAARMVAPVTQLQELVERVARGDLTVEADERSAGELGRMSRALNRMVAGFKAIAARLARAAEKVVTHCQLLRATTGELASGARDQSRQAEQVASSMAEMTETIREVAENARAAFESSQEASTLARRGRDTVEQSVAGVLKISVRASEWASIIEQLDQRSAEIGKIVAVIDDISDQTNLLALNASIEAARAGEHGREFAVVATEVRRLAERTSQATREIRRMIGGIQAESARSIDSMAAGIAEVEASVGLAEQAKAAMDGIVEASERSMDMVHLIANAAEQQSAASNQVLESVEHIAHVTKTFEHSSARIESATHELARTAARLQEGASWFHLPPG
ncbi:MAG: hypothetical protein Kow0092_22170 [Deferrisomatales bacterium]